MYIVIRSIALKYWDIIYRLYCLAFGSDIVIQCVPAPPASNGMVPVEKLTVP